MQRVGDMPKLNHLGHLAKIATCAPHVNPRQRAGRLENPCNPPFLFALREMVESCRGDAARLDELDEWLVRHYTGRRRFRI